MDRLELLFALLHTALRQLIEWIGAHILWIILFLLIVIEVLLLMRGKGIRG